MLGFQVYVLFFPKNVRLSDYKITYVPTGISNIVGNPSGAIRDISRLFEDGNIHLGFSSFCPTGSTHTRRIPTYNHELHLFLLHHCLVWSTYSFSLQAGAHMKRRGWGTKGRATGHPFIRSRVPSFLLSRKLVTLCCFAHLSFLCAKRNTFKDFSRPTVALEQCLKIALSLKA
jgi:hypothetical protein